MFETTRNRYYDISFHKQECGYTHLYIKPDAELLMYFLSELSPIFSQVHGCNSQGAFTWNVYVAVDLPRDVDGMYTLTFYSRDSGCGFTHISFPYSGLCDSLLIAPPPEFQGFIHSKTPPTGVYDPLEGIYVYPSLPVKYVHKALDLKPSTDTCGGKRICCKREEPTEAALFSLDDVTSTPYCNT